MPQDDHDNRKFGRYEVIRRIARGGMGELFLARASGTGGWEKQVAIKTVLPHLSAEVESVARFVDEARIATTLTHGNIVQVFDFDRSDDGTYFIVMEYVDGWDLRWLLKQSKEASTAFSEPLAIFIAAEICRGLDYAHQRVSDDGRPMNIVHRDVSPSNVLISRDGAIKLADFGIAAARNRFKETVTGELRGKFGYMSPEQASGDTVDRRSDIFSTGIILYEMLTGVRPFEAETDMQTLESVRRGKRRRIRELSPAIDAELERIVETALAYEPEDRFQTAETMQIALLGLLYRDTQPVTDRQLASFCRALELDDVDDSESGGGKPGFDTLLRQQLASSAANDAQSKEQPPRIERATPGGAGTGNGGDRGLATPTNGSNGQGKNSLPPMAPPTATQTVDAGRVRPVRRGRRRLQILGVLAILAVTITALVLSYLAGQQGSILPTTLRVETKPAGARVFIDGAPYGLTTLIERVKPGVHVLQIQSDGYRPIQRTVTAGANRLTRVAMHLEPVVAPEDTQTFTTVQMFIEPGDGRITVGDQTARDGETLVVPVGVPVDLTFEADGYESLELTHTFVRGEDRLVRRLDPVDGGPRTEGRSAQNARHGAPPPIAARRPPATDTVRLAGIPSGASVSVNGERLGDVRTVSLPRGRSVVIRVDAPGYASYTERVSPKDWASGELEVTLEELKRGWLTVRFVGDVLLGEIEIDGRNLGENRSGPRARFELTEGNHVLRVFNESTGHELEQRVSIDDSREAVVAVDWSMNAAP